jgi:signal transduction histidine kinase
MHYCTLLIKEKSSRWNFILLLFPIFTFSSCINYSPTGIPNKLVGKQLFFFKNTFEIAAHFKNELNLNLLGIGLTITLLLFLLLKFYKTNLDLLNAIKSRERFFAMFSHDLRGVITNLKDSGDILNYLIKNRRIGDIVEISRQLDCDGSHALFVLNNLLDLGTLTGYSYQPLIRNFIISNKVWDIISTFQSSIDSKNIKLCIEIENEINIYSDEKSIDVVLRNIIANAKKYTPEGGNISIRLVKQPANQIAFIVTNSVSADKIDNLEHIQNILAGKTKPNVGHNGLGLGIILIHEYAKKCDFNLHLSFENNIVTFKVIL